MTQQHPVIIKQVPAGSALHGGAWKVAYADFVTAMMAFFLLLWLLNVTTDEQKNAISNFFDPTHPKVSDSLSGAGGVLGGLSMTPQGSMATNVQNIVTRTPDSPAIAHKTAEDKAKELLKKREEEEFKKAEEAIKQAIQDDPELAKLAENLIIDMTPEGLRIQVVDQEGKPMFASGSAEMFDYTKKLMGQIGRIILGLTNEISVRGHTDSVPYGPGATYTNWELSTDRANSSRRILEASGVPGERLNNVVGKADTEHLLPDEPNSPRNRRISIVLLKEELTNPNYDEKAKRVAEQEGLDDDAAGNASAGSSSGAPPALPQYPPIGTFRKTPGAVEFP